MKKTLSLLLAGAMVVGTLAGCGPTPPAAAPAPAAGGETTAAGGETTAAGGGETAAPEAPAANAELNLIIASN